MKKNLMHSISWLTSSKGKGVGFSLLSLGKMIVALFMFIKQMLIASIFGLSWQTDAFAVALVVPLLLQQVIANSIGSSFIPVLSGIMHRKGKDAADRLTSRIIIWSIITGSLLIGLLIITGSNAISVIGPGMESNALNLGTVMFRIMLPMLILSSISGILLGLLTYQQKYGLRALITVIEIIFSLLLLIIGHKSFGILILPLSTVLSVALSFVILSVIVVKTGFRFHPVVDPTDQDFRKLLRMATPIVFGVVLGFLCPVVDKILASFLSVDSITALSYADRIKNIVLGILFLPLAVVANVTFSKQAAKSNFLSLRNEMTSHLNWTSFFMFPVAVLLTLLATPVIALIFQRGNFDPSNSRHVGYALSFYAPWLAQFGFGVIVTRVFYAMQNTITPVLIGIWGLVVNVLLNFILIIPLGIGGLALATTIASTGKTVLLVYFLRKKMGHINGRNIFREQIKLLCASAIMIAVILVMIELLDYSLYAPFTERAFVLAVWILLASGVYLSMAVLLKSEVAVKSLQIISDRFSSTKNN